MGGEKGEGKKRDGGDENGGDHADYDEKEEEEDKKYREYRSVQRSVLKFDVEYGRTPRILVVKMDQDGHDCVSRVILSGFSDLGFDVNVGPLFSTLGEVADLAANSNVYVIGILYPAAGNLSLFPALRDEIRMRRRKRRTRGGRGRARGTRGARGTQKKRNVKRRTTIW